jgi:hypothetical protein
MRSLVGRVGHGAVGAIIATVVVGGAAAAAVTTDGFGALSASSSRPTTSMELEAEHSSRAEIDDRVTPSLPSTTIPEPSITVVPVPAPTVTLPETTVAPQTTPPVGSAVDAAVHRVADAGTVTVAREGSVLRVVDTSANPGWTAVVERGFAREVEVSFRSEDGRVDFSAELEDGQVRARVRDRGVVIESPVPTDGVNPIPTPSVPTAQSLVQTFSSAGGSVTVVQVGATLTLSVATPAGGYAVDVRERGPDRVEVRFESADGRESRLEVRVRDGRIEPRIEND